MLKLIIGAKGSGKTKTLIELVNSALKATTGSVVCIEKGDKLRFDISYECRLIDTDEYQVKTSLGLYGFVAFLMWMGKDFAADGAMLFGVGISVGLVCLFSAIRQGQVCANGIVGISQGHDVQTNTMIYAALPEFYAILALVAALMI